MRKSTLSLCVATVVFLVAVAVRAALGTGATAEAAQVMDSGPRYKGTSLLKPTDYRDWVFLSSGLGMEYESATSPDGSPLFGNVFVNPTSYRSFMKTGKWPNPTIFVLEFRASKSDGSINKGGRFQGELVGLEAEVKDSRFPDGWAFFNFSRGGRIQDIAEPLAASAGCVECHTKNTAVERTFVQFYPTLMDVARKMGTLKPGY
jgi:hypothetical protein